MEELGDLAHLLLAHRPRGQGVGADTDTAGDGRGLVTRDGVLVEGDVRKVADLIRRNVRSVY